MEGGRKRVRERDRVRHLTQFKWSFDFARTNQLHTPHTHKQTHFAYETITNKILKRFGDIKLFNLLKYKLWFIPYSKGV